MNVFPFKYLVYYLFLKLCCVKSIAMILKNQYNSDYNIDINLLHIFTLNVPKYKIVTYFNFETCIKKD